MTATNRSGRAPYRPSTAGQRRRATKTTIASGAEPPRKARTVRYAYYPDGNVSNITIWDGGDVSKGVYLIHGTNGTLWLAIWQEWEGELPPDDPEEDIMVTDVWEFRYDSGRQRYLARHWNVSHEPGQYPVFTEGDSTWTDYLGPQPYVDYTIESGSPPVIEEQMRYLAGFGVHAQESAGVPPAGPSRDRQGAGFTGDAGLGGPALLGSASSQPVIGAPVFLHGDLTRSTMMTATVGGGGGGTGVSPVVAYTAFGDPVTPDGQGGWRVGFPTDLGTRYQYDGGWGYESGLVTLWGENTTLPPVTLQHVGWRWYQPSLGRFVQRDPIGLKGGLNVYEYVRSSPVNRVDRRGTGVLSHLWEVIKETIKEVFVPAPVAPVEVAGEGAQICVAIAVRSHALKGDAADLDDDGLDKYEKWHGVAYEDDPPPSPPPAPPAPAPAPSPDEIDLGLLVD